jgi:hypothetical protein
MAGGKAVIADALIAAPALDLSVLAERNRSIGWRKPGFAVAAMIEQELRTAVQSARPASGLKASAAAKKMRRAAERKKGAHESPFRHWIDIPQ